jgi:hypothetical protein
MFLSFQGPGTDTSGAFEGITITISDAEVEGYVLVSMSVSTITSDE